MKTLALALAAVDIVAAAKGDADEKPEPLGDTLTLMYTDAFILSDGDSDNNVDSDADALTRLGDRDTDAEREHDVAPPRLAERDTDAERECDAMPTRLGDCDRDKERERDAA